MASTRITINNVVYTIPVQSEKKGQCGEVFYATNPEGVEVAIKKITFDKAAFEKPLHDSIASKITKFETMLATNSLSEEEIAAISKEKTDFIEQIPKFTLWHYMRDAKSPSSVVGEYLNSVRQEQNILQILGESKAEAVVAEVNHLPDSPVESYIVMERVPGISLIAFMLQEERGKMTDPEVCFQIAIQIGEQIQAAEEKGVVMRDIHPNNFMIDPNNLRIRAVDRGDSLAMHGENFVASKAMGSEPYISPEVLDVLIYSKKSESLITEFNPKTSVYSYGAMMMDKIFRFALPEPDPRYVKDVNEETHKETFFYTMTLPDERDAKPIVKNDNLYALIQKATQVKPARRPDMDTILKDLHTIRNEYRASLQSQSSAGVAAILSSSSAAIASMMHRPVDVDVDVFAGYVPPEKAPLSTDDVSDSATVQHGNAERLSAALMQAGSNENYQDASITNTPLPASIRVGKL
jgi:serine/threonine protein kinase